MRNRRNQGNRKFHRGGPRKPRGLEGLPADEPDLPLPGTARASAAPIQRAPAESTGAKTSPADPNQPAPIEGAAPAVAAEPPPPLLPPGPHLEVENLQAM